MPWSLSTPVNDLLLQVLRSWKKALPEGYTVNHLMDAIHDWHCDGYLRHEVWEHLKECVSLNVLDCNQDTMDERQIALGIDSSLHTEQDTVGDIKSELVPEHVRQKNPVLITVEKEKSQLRARPETVSSVETTAVKSKHFFNHCTYLFLATST